MSPREPPVPSLASPESAEGDIEIATDKQCTVWNTLNPLGTSDPMISCGGLAYYMMATKETHVCPFSLYMKTKIAPPKWQKTNTMMLRAA